MYSTRTHRKSRELDHQLASDPPTGEALNSSDLLVSAIERMQSEPWPIRDLVAKLEEAAGILLDEKHYDGHGWELIAGCRKRAQEFLEETNVVVPSRAGRESETD